MFRTLHHMIPESTIFIFIRGEIPENFVQSTYSDTLTSRTPDIPSAYSTRVRKVFR